MDNNGYTNLSVYTNLFVFFCSIKLLISTCVLDKFVTEKFFSYFHENYCCNIGLDLSTLLLLVMRSQDSLRIVTNLISGFLEIRC